MTTNTLRAKAKIDWHREQTQGSTINDVLAVGQDGDRDTERCPVLCEIRAKYFLPNRIDDKGHNDEDNDELLTRSYDKHVVQA